MNKKIEEIVDLIFHKLKKYNSRDIKLEKNELKRFIYYLIEN